MIESGDELDFEWGVFDCALHVCNCIKAVTDQDPAASYRRTYSDAAGAAAIYGSSFEDFIAGMASSLGMPEVPVSFARRGDVVYVDNDTPLGAIGVVSLDGRYASCASARGTVLVAIWKWKRAWQVG
jgi:hypothetical protein